MSSADIPITGMIVLCVFGIALDSSFSGMGIWVVVHSSSRYCHKISQNVTVFDIFAPKGQRGDGDGIHNIKPLYCMAFGFSIQLFWCFVKCGNLDGWDVIGWERQWISID